MGMVTLRPVVDEDFAFLWWLHQATMRDYVEKTWGWDDAFQAQRFRDAFVADRDGMAIVEVAAERIGYLRVVRDQARWFLAGNRDRAIAPEAGDRRPARRVRVPGRRHPRSCPLTFRSSRSTRRFASTNAWVSP